MSVVYFCQVAVKAVVRALVILVGIVALILFLIDLILHS